jgi:DNA-binding NarL/FixJ family response regulator
MMMPEETNMLVIEDTDDSTVNLTLLNLAAGERNPVAVLRQLITNDPSAVIALLIPADIADSDVIVEAVMAGAKAYIKKPAPHTNKYAPLITC